ncbi:MAG: putative anti sigma factor [Gemmatimonadetes bacterium]|nr:putative anti sigma factor [Gemmatimonadota bacterium]
MDTVQRECQAMHFAPRQVMLNVPVALSEALSNAICRGNGEDPRKHVRITAVVDERELVIEVTDEGGGFDLEAQLTDPTTPDKIGLEDGRGLFLMRKLMDLVEAFPTPDLRGSVVRLTLHRG